MKAGFTQFVNADVLAIFPRKMRAGTAIDERCGCGHLRSNHYGPAPIAGHGACGQTPCDCNKFTWAEHVYQSQRRR